MAASHRSHRSLVAGGLAACLAVGAEAFVCPSGVAPSLSMRNAGGTAACVRGSAWQGGRALCGLRMQEKEGGEKSVVDKIAGKGIWQMGVGKEASEALASVGWADADEVDNEESVAEEGSKVKELPRFEREDIEGLVAKAVAAETFADERSKEMFTADSREQLVKELVRREVKEDLGVELDDLLNPIKVVSLETKIISAEAALAAGCISAEEEESLRAEMNDNLAKLSVEKRAVMKDWLKIIFRAQAAISIVVGGYLANTPDVPIYGRALGFWIIWLFTIPSLRAVKPLGYPSAGVTPEMEKKALNLAFVLTPLLTLALPVLTKDTATIFWADFLTLAACYGVYYLKGDDGSDEGGVEIKGVLRYLDYGTGRERGARK